MKKKQLIIWLVLAMVLNMLGVVPTITNEPNTAYAAEDDEDEGEDLDDDSDNEYTRTHTPTPKPYEIATPTPEEKGWPEHVIGEYHRYKTNEKGYIYDDGSYVTESGLLEGVFDLSAIIKGAKKTDYTFYKIPSWVKTISKGALNSPVIKDECRILTIPTTVKKICAGALANYDGFNDRCVDVTFTQTTWNLTGGEEEVYRERSDKYVYEGEFSDNKYCALHTIRFETGDCEMVTGCIDTSWDLTIVAPTGSNAYKYAQVYGYWHTSSEEVQPLRKKVDTLVDMHEAVNLANAPARVYWSVEGKDKDKVFIHGATGHFFAVRPCKVTIVATCEGKRYEIPATFKKRTVKKVRKYITDYVGKKSSDGVKLFYMVSYVNHHCVYDGAHWGGLVLYLNKDPRKYTKEGVYIDSKAVCDGFSKFCFDICNYWNIPCKRIVSYERNHAWNEVKLYGKWRTLDLTNAIEWVRHPGAIKKETVKERFEYVIDTYDGVGLATSGFIQNKNVIARVGKGIFNNDGKIRNTYVNQKNWKETPLLKK